MTFEFTDESLLKLSSSMVVAHALPAMFASESIHQTYNVETISRDKNMERWWIHGLWVNAAQGYVISKGDSTQAKKNLLKVHGAGWAAAAALDLYHAFGTKTQKPEVSICGALSQGLLAAVLLYQGFSKPKKAEEKKKKNAIRFAPSVPLPVHGLVTTTR